MGNKLAESSATEVPAPVLAVRGLSKAFGGTRALDSVDLDLFEGSIHALLGENGAGKSTLIKIVAGVHRADRGSVALNGATLPPGARPPGAAFIHQELGLVETMTIAENVALARGYPLRRSLISWRRVRKQAEEDLSRVGLEVDLLANVASLSAADRALVAVGRALALRPRVLVLDEPTAPLPETDVARLFDVLARLRDDGLAILYVSHRLDEVFRICDYVTVVRDGRRVLACPLASTTPSTLVEAITGRQAARPDLAPQPATGPTVLRVSELLVDNVGPVSFEVGEGEIVALVGLRGAGHELVARALFGDVKVKAGWITLGTGSAVFRNVREAVSHGVGLVPGNRYAEGIASGLNVRENLALNPALGVGAGKWVGLSRERRRAAELMARFDVRPRDAELGVTTLSGGNQQKVVLARWMEAGCRLLVLEDPTSGVDVGARSEIYTLVTTMLVRHVAVVLISSDFEEVASLAQRALVMRRGKVVGELKGNGMSLSSLTATSTGAQASVA